MTIGLVLYDYRTGGYSVLYDYKTSGKASLSQLILLSIIHTGTMTTSMTPSPTSVEILHILLRMPSLLEET